LEAKHDEKQRQDQSYIFWWGVYRNKCHNHEKKTVLCSSPWFDTAFRDINFLLWY
jgi:hypothetical protein